MKLLSFCSLLLVEALFMQPSTCQGFIKHKPAQGIFVINLDNSTPAFIAKTLYNGTAISVHAKADIKQCKYKGDVYLHLTIIGSTCKGMFSSFEWDETTLVNCLLVPESCIFGHRGIYLQTRTKLDCEKPTVITSSDKWTIIESKNDKNISETPKEEPKISRKRRSTNTSLKSELNKEGKKLNNSGAAPISYLLNAVTTVVEMGEYMVILSLRNEGGVSLKDVSPENSLSFEMTVKLENPVGYLSADEYPLLTFYLIMCIVYVLYAVAWLVMSVCNFHDLLRVQFWIGGVILLGLIEKAVHYSEYLNVNSMGKSEIGTEKFAAVVSSVKRTVARMLVIIVSLGFGIVKPRLGPVLHRVIGIGLIYFVVALLEKMLSIDVYFNEGSREALVFMYIPLAIIDSIICYWIFVSLLQTMKTLRLRRNTTKLALYRHFANTIVFCIIISLAMMIWSIYFHRQGCSKNLAYSWFETACWPLLFSFILLVIMILWRPNANNQRYAYSPIIDGNGSDEEDIEEPMLGSGATETIKMRGSKKIVRSDVDQTEEDLKWIEENIPQTVADAALPALLDSDEEAVTTKYEMNKME